MTYQKHCPRPHQWTQSTPFIPDWVQIAPSIVKCSPKCPPVTPNPVFPSSATLPMCTPLELKKTGPGKLLITVSIPAESVITLPTKALEIKTINKKLKITQCRFFNSVPSVPCLPHDTPKLFIGGFVRKDIQYSEAVCQTPSTVEGAIKDFVVDIPILCVVDLGKHFTFPPIHFDQQKEYGFSKSAPLPFGYSSKDKLLSDDPTEFNLVSQDHLNSLPSSELVFYQINEMDDSLDRVPLPGGPFEEGVFKTLQEKMIVLFQIQLTFQTDHGHHPDFHHEHSKTKKC